MKKMKKIMAAAIAMMTFSTAAAVTGTVAWFTASNIVSASGMSIQADTEQGILISNEGFATWKDSVVASHNGEITVEGATQQAKFIPTSTYDATKWYHANSSDYNAAESGQESSKYATFNFGNVNELNVNGTATGVYQITKGSLAITNKNVFLLNKFYLKASTIEDFEAEKLYVNEVNAAVDGGATAQSENLNKALRVLVTCKVESTLHTAFFAPFEQTSECVDYVVAGVAAQTYKPVAKDVKDTVLVDGAVIVPGSETANEDTLEINVYVYFEGEDANCKSANIVATLDKLSLDLKFGTNKLA